MHTLQHLDHGQGGIVHINSLVLLLISQDAGVTLFQSLKPYKTYIQNFQNLRHFLILFAIQSPFSYNGA